MKLGFKDIVYVGIQFILFLAYLYDVPFLYFKIPDILKDVFLFVSFFGTGMVLLSVLQLNVHLSPFPSPKKGSRLIKSGLYKYIRHPIYSGILVGLIGFGFYTTSSYRLLICVGLSVLFYYKSGYEEKRLQHVFSNYKNYQKTTGRFFPRF